MSGARVPRRGQAASVQLNVRLTPPEDQALRRKAKAAKLSVSEYVRRECGLTAHPAVDV